MREGRGKREEGGERTEKLFPPAVTGVDSVTLNLPDPDPAVCPTLVLELSDPTDTA